MNCISCKKEISDLGQYRDGTCQWCNPKEIRTPAYSLKSIKEEREKTTSPLKEDFDPVNKPKHYNSHPSGIECIDITRHMPFNIGNAIKYLWRFDNKNGVEDLKKAIWYIQDQIKLLETEK